MSENSNSSSGINFIGLLTLLFVGLKLTDNIDWSWLWVLSPLWISASIIIVIVLVVITISSFMDR